MDLGLTDRVALVTGADSGIGWHTARTLLEEGARVIVSDLDSAQLDDAANALLQQTGVADDRLIAVAADVTDQASVDALHRTVTERLRARRGADGASDGASADGADRTGGPDILVNAAGITGATGDFAEITDQGWLQTLQTDLLGPVRVTRAFLPQLRASGRGRVVFLTSENAVQPYPEEIPYDAAKAAVLATAKALSRSYAADGLLVNCVSPAFIRTPMTDAMMRRRADQLGVDTDEAVRSFLADKRSTLELQRRGEPDEVAAVIAFLCSDRASFVTGADYRVDGGSVAAIN